MTELLRSTIFKVFAGLLVFSIGVHMFQRIQFHSLRADVAEAAAQELVSANSESQKVIDEYKAATDELVRMANAQQQAIIAAGDRMQQMAVELVAARNKLKEVEQRDKANPECAELLNIDLGSVCPGFAGGVFQRSADSLPNALRRSPGADPTAARHTVDL